MKTNKPDIPTLFLYLSMKENIDIFKNHNIDIINLLHISDNIDTVTEIIDKVGLNSRNMDILYILNKLRNNTEIVDKLLKLGANDDTYLKIDNYFKNILRNVKTTISGRYTYYIHKDTSILRKNDESNTYTIQYDNLYRPFSREFSRELIYPSNIELVIETYFMNYFNILDRGDILIATF